MEQHKNNVTKLCESMNLEFILSVICSYRYKHDSSETIADSIEFTATDGTNSAIFVLQVEVSYMRK